jgi:hypothetical protein
MAQFSSTLVENVMMWQQFCLTISKLKTLEEVLRHVGAHFDTFRAWISTKHGTPSVFWACIVRLAQLLPKPSQVIDTMEGTKETVPFVFLALFVRITFVPLAVLEVYAHFNQSLVTLEFGDERVAAFAFLKELLTEQKMWDVVFPEPDLVEARKINWRLYCLSGKGDSPLS